MSKKIVIVGAGVVGAASALALQKEGHLVTLIDKEAPCSGASFGNAGAIVNGSCAPTAMPGAFFDAMRMLLRKDSPLTIKASYFHKITPWLIRFLMQSRISAVEHNATQLHALSQYAVASWQQLTKNTELSSLFRETGWLKVYQSDQSFVGTAQSRALLNKLGTPYEILSADEIRELEPNLAPIFKRGFYQKDSLSIVSPKNLVEGMVTLFVSRGGCYKQFAVDKIIALDDSIKLTGTNGDLITDKVIIAAGTWSRTLAKQLGDNIPLDTERGYHLMLPESTASLLNRPVVNGDNSFVLSPMETGMRITGQVEFAGIKAAPDYSRIRRLLPLAKQMLPQLDISEKSVWMGMRPSLPDSLPVIGLSSMTPNVLYAFGHQHLGMTLAAITANVVADILSSRVPKVAISPYRPNRFNLL